MLKLRQRLQITLLSLLPLCISVHADEQIQSVINKTEVNSEQTMEMVLFTPPENWQAVESKKLLPSVKAMVVGKGNYEFPPSINLGTEKYSGTLKQYLKKIKEVNDSQGAAWKDLGSIRTEAGKASLSQVDRKTEWGDVRMMHAILLKNGTIYIMTATARKEEFPTLYKTFFNALSSLRFEQVEANEIKN